MKVIAISYGDDPHVISIVRHYESQSIRQQLDDYAAVYEVKHPEKLKGVSYVVQEPFTAARFFDGVHL